MTKGFSLVETVLVLVVIAVLIYLGTHYSSTGTTVAPAVIKQEAQTVAVAADVSILQDAYERAKLMKPEVLTKVTDDSVVTLVTALREAGFISQFDAAQVSVRAGTSISGGSAIFELH